MLVQLKAKWATLFKALGTLVEIVLYSIHEADGTDISKNEIGMEHGLLPGKENKLFAY